jgi:hypothetical protein
MTKPIDLEGILLNAEQINRLQARKQRKAWRREYVRVPWAWVERLQAARRVSTYRLALLLLYEHWRTGGQPVVLSNIWSQAEGLSPRSKWNALAELERNGLVEVKRHRRRAPRATLQHMNRD